MAYEKGGPVLDLYLKYLIASGLLAHLDMCFPSRYQSEELKKVAETPILSTIFILHLFIPIATVGFLVALFSRR